MQMTSEAVTVWTTKSVPIRILWQGTRYKVTDTPTALYGFIAEAPTHPLKPRIGWRFQGTSEDGTSYVFDVRQSSRQEWELMAVYD